MYTVTLSILLFHGLATVAMVVGRRSKYLHSGPGARLTQRLRPLPQDFELLAV